MFLLPIVRKLLVIWSIVGKSCSLYWYASYINACFLPLLLHSTLCLHEYIRASSCCKWWGICWCLIHSYSGESCCPYWSHRCVFSCESCWWITVWQTWNSPTNYSRTRWWDRRAERRWSKLNELKFTLLCPGGPGRGRGRILDHLMGLLNKG